MEGVGEGEGEVGAVGEFLGSGGELGLVTGGGLEGFLDLQEENGVVGVGGGAANGFLGDAGGVGILFVGEVSLAEGEPGVGRGIVVGEDLPIETDGVGELAGGGGFLGGGEEGVGGWGLLSAGGSCKLRVLDRSLRGRV